MPSLVKQLLTLVAVDFASHDSSKAPHIEAARRMSKNGMPIFVFSLKPDTPPRLLVTMDIG